MSYVTKELFESCPLCGGQLHFDYREDDCTRRNFFYYCQECGAEIQQKFDLAETEVYTFNEWESDMPPVNRN